jgi:hypothetical protein
VIGRCDSCKHWTRLAVSHIDGTHAYWSEHGMCKEISTMVQGEQTGANDDSYATTRQEFGCVLYAPTTEQVTT